MKIINLVENTPGTSGCGVEHGLSFYIETEKHILLVDTGASELMIQNAEKLGVDLAKVDTVILSHGHYDHGGGIPAFLKVNETAKVYMQESAFGEYYSQAAESEEPRYVGLPSELAACPRIIRLSGDYRIDDELFILSGITDKFAIPATNQALKVQTEKGLVPDAFVHEQCLEITQDGKRILLSGCAHHGILNIMENYKDYAGRDPDIVISGFHLMRKGMHYSEDDADIIVHTALELKKYNTIFYTGHCTGEKPYEAMKKIMGDQLHYVHSGDEIKIAPPAAAGAAATGSTASTSTAKSKSKRRNTYMKWHKFFAWATVICFLITMMTGYERK